MTAHSTPARVAVREVVPVSKQTVPIVLLGAPARAIIDQDGCTWLYFADVCTAIWECTEIETTDFKKSDYFAYGPDGTMLISAATPLALSGPAQRQTTGADA